MCVMKFRLVAALLLAVASSNGMLPSSNWFNPNLEATVGGKWIQPFSSNLAHPVKQHRNHPKGRLGLEPEKFEQHQTETDREDGKK